MAKSFTKVMRLQSKKLIKIFNEIAEAASGNTDYGNLESAYESMAVAAMKAKTEIEASEAKTGKESQRYAAIETMKDLAVAGRAGSIGAKKLDEGSRLVTLSVETIQGALPRLEEWGR